MDNRNKAVDLELRFLELFKKLKCDRDCAEDIAGANEIAAMLAAADMADFLREHPEFLTQEITGYEHAPSGLYLLLNEEFGRHMFLFHADLFKHITPQVMCFPDQFGVTPLHQLITDKRTMSLLGADDFSSDLVNAGIFNLLNNDGISLATKMLISESGLKVLASRPDIVSKIHAESINAIRTLSLPLDGMGEARVCSYARYPVVAYMLMNDDGKRVLEMPELREKVSADTWDTVKRLKDSLRVSAQGMFADNKKPAQEERVERKHACVLQ